MQSQFYYKGLLLRAILHYCKQENKVRLNQTETTQKLNLCVLRKCLELKQTCVNINLTMLTEFDATMKKPSKFQWHNCRNNK